jgi:hypothetical protein
VLALVLGSGCGEPGADAPGVARIELVVCTSDGQPPREGLTVERVERSGLGPPLPLRPVAGEPLLFDAPGVVDGSYHLKLPDAWGHLFINRLPRLTPGGPPARVRVGRPHSFYLVSHQPRRLLGDTWGALRPHGDGAPGTPIPLEVEQDPHGITILRVAPEHWDGPLVLMGRFVDGGLTQTWVGQLKPPGKPIYYELDPEPLAPARVVVAAPQPVPDDTVEVELRVLGLPLPESQRGKVRGGRVDLPGVSVGGTGVEVQVGAAGPASIVHFAAGAFHAVGDLRVHLPPASPTPARVVLEGVTDGPDLVVQVRTEGGDGYGVVPVQRVAGSAPHVLLDAGRWRMIIDDGTTFRTRQLHVHGPTHVETLQDLPPEPPATVQGYVEGAIGPRLVWERIEDGRRVLGHGFVLPTQAGGRYRGRLPAGAYELVVEDARGQRHKPRRVDLTPGMQLSLPMRLP